MGDGTQCKSYLYIDDCIDASLLAVEKVKSNYEAINIGSAEKIDVKRIADLVSGALDPKNIKYSYTGGKRGWDGDVPLMLLDISKIKTFGWHPKIKFEDGVHKYIEYLKRDENE